MNRRRAHGARPQISAALRRAFEVFEADRDLFAGDRLAQISVAKRDYQPVIERLFDYFGDTHERDGHPVKEGLNTLRRLANAGDDPDAGPLMESINALPEGELTSLFSMLDLVCAFAAAEGMALGAAYVGADMNGRSARARTRPHR